MAKRIRRRKSEDEQDKDLEKQNETLKQTEDQEKEDQKGKEKVKVPTAPKLKQFSNPIEVYEIKIFEVIARNKLDVVAAMKTLLQSQDKVDKITPKRGLVYEVLVRIFRMRDE